MLGELGVEGGFAPPEELDGTEKLDVAEDVWPPCSETIWMVYAPAFRLSVVLREGPPVLLINKPFKYKDIASEYFCVSYAEIATGEPEVVPLDGDVMTTRALAGRSSKLTIPNTTNEKVFNGSFP